MSAFPPPQNTENCLGIKKIEPEPSGNGKNHLSMNDWLQNVEVSCKMPSSPDKGAVTRSIRSSKFEQGSYFYSKSPLLVSPSHSTSTTPSPGVNDNIWDSPLPSRDYLGPTSERPVSTPLTPPDEIVIPGKRNRTLREEQFSPLRGLGSTINSRVLIVDKVEDSDDGDQYETRALEELDFKPRQLFRSPVKESQARNLVFDLGALSEINKLVPVADGKPAAFVLPSTLEPNFNFGTVSKSRQSSAFHRPRATARARDNASSENTELHTPKHEVACTQTTSTDSLRRILDHILPTTLRSRVLNNQRNCVASLVTKQDSKCTSKCPGGDVIELCRVLSHCKIMDNASALLECIRQLIRTVTCGTHQRAAFSQKRWPILENLILNFAHLLPAERSTVLTWLENITQEEVLPVESHDNKKGMTRTSLEPQGKPQVAPQMNSGADQGAISTVQYLDMINYQPKWTKNMAVSDVLLKIITKPLKPTDLKSGFIYMFWLPGKFGKIKIGRTDNLDRRLKEWNTSCKREHEYLPAIPRGELPNIAHVSRIERLIHTELKEYRRSAYCSTCGTDHREWFEVEDALVVEVFQKWRDWILQRPYELDPISGEWMLRPEIMDTVAEVCKPAMHQVKVELSVPDLKPKPRRKSGRKSGYMKVH
ncbi:T5orf172 domain-containing protein [Phaeosphaeria sp. MPI-PUGE-AT-0046c]|nr:T5orf172 domain-containing protein [Phaeosphaeria sp. MPI-PUGE-AT-0046c]